MKKKIIVIGGGFFGLYLSEYMALRGHDVTLLEKESGFMRRASFVNQARVHNGYHYPRSVLTALRSRVSYPRFVEEFRDCIDDRFEKYYLVGKILSKVTGRQFEQFCQRIGAACQPAPEKIRRLVNPHYVEACFTAEECAFDSEKLAALMRARVDAAGVTWRLGTEVRKVENSGNQCIVTCSENGKGEEFAADHVFNTAYAHLNDVTVASGLSAIPLKHELTEMCLVDVPDEIKNCGITVMCGPFFSVMPFPAANCHSFSHVRYTPQQTWHEGDEEETFQPPAFDRTSPPPSAWQAMQRDAMRYMPVLAECRYQRSLWDIKTTLPRSERDDSRPILYKPNYGLKGYHCIMGGKIDNIYDVTAALETQGLVNQ